MAEEQPEEDSEQKVDEKGGGQLVVEEVEAVREEAEAVRISGEEKGVGVVGLEVEFLFELLVEVVYC
jgi:hypothetical protein